MSRPDPPTSTLALRNATPEEQALLDQVDPRRLPLHLAVIMDGNRRWARQRSLPAIMGHRAGSRSFREVVRASVDLGIGTLTAYAFSLENWRRSSTEVGVLMHLFEHYSRKDRNEMLENGVRFQTIGDLDDLPQRVRQELERTMEATRHNDRMVLNLAVSYGARGEILRAVRALAEACKRGEMEPEAITEEAFAGGLYTAGQPDPDLLIRTSGEVRVSNFLLWQMAYTELWFTPRLWPDFRRLDLLQALLDFQGRERRFGAGSEPAAPVRPEPRRRMRAVAAARPRLELSR